MKEIYDLSIERSILSAILFNPEVYEDVSEILKANDFYHMAHKKIFSAFEQLNTKDDPLSVDFLKKQMGNEFDEEAIIEIVATTPIANLTPYLKDLKDKATKRNISKLANSIQKGVIEEKPNDVLLEELQSAIYAISQDSTESDFKDTKKVLISTLAQIKALKDRGNSILAGLDTGFMSLNRKTAGFKEGDLVIIAARPAMGKCLGKGTKVLMFDGELKNVEDIKVGELLMGDNSTPRKVLGIARGQEKMYFIRQNKGIDYRVNESHILSLKRSRNEGKHINGDILNISVRDYLQKSDKFKSNYKGYKVAVEFQEQDLEIEPYFLGIWLGDGTSSNVSIATKDIEVIEYLNYYAKALNLEVRENLKENKCPMYSITTAKQGGNPKKFSLQKILNDLNLLNNKHIPKNFLINSTKNRLELLAGLIDSDGHYDKQCNGYEITQKNENLAKQIKFLCDSLGFRTSLISKKAKIKNINYECDVYRVRFFGDVDKIPVKVKRKKAKEWSCNRSWNQTGIKVEFDKVDDYYGFEIDGNKLFLLEDMTVTHNTSFVLNIALQAIKRDEGVAFFSLEMSAEQLMLRLLSAHTDFSLQDLTIGNLQDHDWDRLSRASENIANKKLFIDDYGSLNINQLKGKLRKLKSKHPEVKLAIIDYLQLMSGTGAKDRHLEVSEISRGLKMLARELEIPIIALSQLNRGLESRSDKRPMLSDLRESGAIEQDADLIMFVYREDVYKHKDEQEKVSEAKKKGETYDSKYKYKDEEEAEIIIGKQRNGPTGTVILKFKKSLTKFIDPETTEVEYITKKEEKNEMEVEKEKERERQENKKDDKIHIESATI